MRTGHVENHDHVTLLLATDLDDMCAGMREHHSCASFLFFFYRY